MEKLIKRIPRKIKFYEYLITFSYETVGKKYYREQQRTMFASDNEDIKTVFNDWSKQQRTMSNVKILGITKYENEVVDIEI